MSEDGGMARYFGKPVGILPGAEFPSRQALRQAGVHMPNQAGISGTAWEGADSVVLSGGYGDDEYCGRYITYTGEGGNRSGVQVEDQHIYSRGNAALVLSMERRLPVRVSRKLTKEEVGRRIVYRYEGLYLVTSYERERSAQGPYIIRFRLESIERGDRPASSGS